MCDLYGCYFFTQIFFLTGIVILTKRTGSIDETLRITLSINNICSDKMCVGVWYNNIHHFWWFQRLYLLNKLKSSLFFQIHMGKITLIEILLDRVAC